ncbi:MAG: LCP family protein [Acutalibacteraceae bacterium]
MLVLSILDANRSTNKQTEYQNNTSAIYIDGSPYELKSDIETILFMGTDKYNSDEIEESSFRNDMQNDFNFLIVIDNDSEKITPILINRDTMTDIQTYSVSGKKSGMAYEQLALAHTYGTGESDSCVNVIEAVSSLLYDVNIEHYAAVSLDAIPVLNDAVGGVCLTLLDDLSSLDSSMVKGKEITLKGKQAEYYVRTRYGLDDSTNENRMERQKQYISSWVESAKQYLEKDSSFAEDTIIKVNNYLTTDMSVSSLSKLSEKISKYEQESIVEFDGTSSVVDNHVQFTPDDSAVKKIVLDTFYTPYKEP